MNELSTESSPYLLQHRNNPVNWHAWNERAWSRAREENKMVLISIGYSACHWCHVMEHEVFEDQESAEYMNAHFVCIKVDREERPDIDAIYMDAVHLMGGRGGWPLNVFAMSDGRPVYGGTYFPKQQWLSILENLVHLYKTEPQKMIDYAEKLNEGLNELNVIQNDSEGNALDKSFIQELITKWSAQWDMIEGGSGRSPKFPMPDNLQLVMQYGVLEQDQNALTYVQTTLDKMALGGLYDQVGGGFSRYSVDAIWKVPHFEKMLYDNAQLIVVYAQAYRIWKNPFYLEIIVQTIEWAEREMMSSEGLFYAALDADSEGVEGLFYTWTSNELKEVLGDLYPFAEKYYSVDKMASWEHDRNILLRQQSDEEFAKLNNLSLNEVGERRKEICQILLHKRSFRIRPGLDNKCIVSWNALMVKAYVECYQSTSEESYLMKGQALVEAMSKLFLTENFNLAHTYTSGKIGTQGFLDDYAFFAEACISLYEISFNEKYLTTAESLVHQILQNFKNEENDLFYFTSSKSEQLITRKTEVQDNVIPSSNSVLAHVFWRLAHHMSSEQYEKMSIAMLNVVFPQINYASGYSNWLRLYHLMVHSNFELVATGNLSHEMMKEMQSHYLPNCLFAASTKQSELPLLKGRFTSDSAIYVCANKTCYAPVQNVAQALSLLNEHRSIHHG